MIIESVCVTVIRPRVSAHEPNVRVPALSLCFPEHLRFSCYLAPKESSHYSLQLLTARSICYPPFRNSLLSSLNAYANEHYASSTFSVFPTENDNTLAILLVANKYSPSNFWFGFPPPPFLVFSLPLLSLTHLSPFNHRL